MRDPPWVPRPEWRLLTTVLPALALLAACGGGGAKGTPADGGAPSDDGSVTDGAMQGGDGGLDVLPSGATVAAPMAPAPPVLTPCPDGWRTVMTAPDEPSVCEPWPASGYQSCPAGQAHMPGTPGCAAVGDACPSGTFRDDVPAGAHVLYVQAGAAAGGDGSEALPFRAIADATAVATPGTIIALSAGDYDEAVVLSDGVELWGACPEQTHLTLTMPGTATATIAMRGANTALRDVFVSGAKDGIDVDSGTATITGVAIEHATRVALEVWGGSTATIDDVVMRDTELDPADHITAWGLSVDGGATATASHVAIERCGFAAASADAIGSVLTLSDSVISHPRATEDAAATGQVSGFGLAADDSGQVHLDAVVVEHATYAGMLIHAGGLIDGTSVLVRDVLPLDGTDGSTKGVDVRDQSHLHLARSRLIQAESGVSADGADADVELEDSIVEDAVATPMGFGGAGVSLYHGASGSLTRVLVRRALILGVFAEGAESHFDLTDVALKDTGSEPADGIGGMGVFLDNGGSANVTRVLVDGAVLSGVDDVGAGALRGTDVAIRNVAPEPGDYFKGFGIGLDVQAGAQVDLTRVSVSHATTMGALLRNDTTHVTLHDLRIDSTEAAPPDFPYADRTRFGRGLIVQTAATVDVERAVLADNREIAVEVDQAGTSLTLGDVLVRDSRPDLTTNSGGRGLDASGGAHVTVTGARFERNQEVALSAYGMGTDVALSDVDILDTAENACASDTCTDMSAGFGIVSAMGASIHATRFLVTRSALCGVQVASGAGLDLTQGEVSHNVIGANVQVPGFDVGRISDGVVYQDNQSNLDSDTLPVPSPATGVPDAMMPGMM